MQWINDTWLPLAHHPYPEGVFKGISIIWNNTVISSWWFRFRFTQVSKLSLWIGWWQSKGKTKNCYRPVCEINCWPKVPYVTVSPFWWNIQRQGELKVIRICVWCTSCMMCFKGFSGTNVLYYLEIKKKERKFVIDCIPEAQRMDVYRS